ncbi:questin oxidase family protein [Microbispora sp. NPDC049125]|uniref:questin oxidase family protein n=1 Tax=Microbispora sp. NPDC049125 TaxID=3154929 RepID=UPI0034676DDD
MAMNEGTTGTLAEAYDRFRRTGPEWGEDQLTNHGPMAAEVLVRRGRADVVERWVGSYIRRLDDLPAAGDPITEENWMSALGDGRRIGDWSAYFERQVREQPWRDVVVTWWPRLLPGIVAGTTHGVIRVGHAVRALVEDGVEGPAALTELAHGLAFWAARALRVPGVHDLSGGLRPGAALDAVARIPDQTGNVRSRFGQLAKLPEWPSSVSALRGPSGPDDVRTLLTELVTAATLHYLTHGHASPVLLVHTATAPNAVLHTLPVLPYELWAPSLTAIWATSAAIVSAYAPAEAAPRAVLPVAPVAEDPVEEVLDRAVAHGDEHVIKFTDTAADVYRWTGEPDALAAALRIGTLIGRP